MRSVLLTGVRVLDQWYWLVLFVSAPLLLFPSSQMVVAWLIVPAGWLVAWLAGRGPVPVTPLNVTVLVLYLMVLVSLWATYDVMVSLPKVGGMILGIGVLYAVTREGVSAPWTISLSAFTDEPLTSSSPPSSRLGLSRGWWAAFVLFAGLGLGMALLGTLGMRPAGTSTVLAFVLSRFIPGIPASSALGQAINGNEVAGALLWVLPVCLALSALWLICLGRLRGRLGLPRAVGLVVSTWVATLLIAGVLTLTRSRGAYAALGVSLLLMLFVVLPRRQRQLLAGAMAIALIGFAVVAQQAGGLTVWDSLAGPTGTSEPTAVVDTVEARLAIWSRAVYGIEDFMLTGMGMNTFRHVIRDQYPLSPVGPRLDIAHAHNEYLQAALDLGLPGLVAFLALYVGAFWMLWEIWVTSSETDRDGLSVTSFSGTLRRTLALGLGGGLVAHMIYGLTDAVALGAKPGLLFWMLLGLIAGLHIQMRKRPAHEVVSSPAADLELAE